MTFNAGGREEERDLHLAAGPTPPVFELHGWNLNVFSFSKPDFKVKAVD